MKCTLKSGSTINYQDAGQGSALVLLHAFPLDHTMWQAQVEALQEHHRVIAPDFRGFGASSIGEGDPGVERMADDIAELIGLLDVGDKVTLGGLSMGGYVALSFVRKYPQMLRGLVLADTRAEGDTEEGRAKRDEMIQVAAHEGARGVIERMLPNMLCKTTHETKPEIVEQVRAIASRQSIEGVQNALRALRDRPDARPLLGHLRVPTLIVVGADDTLTPLAMSETLANNILNAELVVIPEAGHLSNLEQPEAFTVAVRDFLRQVEPASNP